MPGGSETLWHETQLRVLGENKLELQSGTGNKFNPKSLSLLSEYLKVTFQGTVIHEPLNGPTQLKPKSGTSTTQLLKGGPAG